LTKISGSAILTHEGYQILQQQNSFLNCMKNTREKVLETLLKYQSCTINTLADEVGINPISVRHHIAKLEAEDLVASEEEIHGVGRPRRVYSLTTLGREKFPTRYLQLTSRLLDQLKETVPQPFINKLFTQMAEALVSDYQTGLDQLSIEERLDLVTELLTSEGFQVTWERDGEEYYIREINCPYYYIGKDHPEVCSVDQTLISKVLAVPASKIKCILNGDTHCTYIVPATIETNSDQQEAS